MCERKYWNGSLLGRNVTRSSFLPGRNAVSNVASSWQVSQLILEEPKENQHQDSDIADSSNEPN